MNPLGNKTSANPNDYKTVLKYTSKGLIEETIDSMGHSTNGKYDTLGRSIASTLPKGNDTPNVDDYTIKTEYNALDLPTKVTDQRGNVSEVTYDNAGNVLTTKDASGSINTMTYDLMGRLLTMTNADGVASYTYNTVGQVLTITDAKNNVTSYTYNKSGDVTKVTDPKLNSATMTYNKVGQVLTSKDPTLAITKFYYDDAGNQIAVEDAQGKMSGTVYDNANQVTRSYDKEGRSTTYAYDDNGRLVKTTLPDESTTLSEYDANGNQIKRTNGEGDEETWAYDSLNRVVSYTDQEGKIESYTYDSHSNAVTTTLENGSVIGTEYDEKDLPTLIDYVGTSKDTEFTYNSLDLVTKEKVGLKESNTTYDHAGRILTRNGITYEYDVLGNQEKIMYPSGRIVDYTYDVNQNLMSAASADIGNIAYAYDKRNLLTSTTLPNGVIETRVQDSLARTTNISISNTTQELHAVSKTYSPNSNLTTSKYGVGSSVQSESYEHDNLNRTTNVTSTINNATGNNAYNKANHLTTFEGKPVISDKVGKPLTIGATEFTYDDLGQRISQKENLATTPEEEYSWSIDGTLSEAKNTLSTVEYDYAPSGLVDERSSNGVSKDFTWDENASNALMLSDGDYEYIYGASRVPVAQIELATRDVEYLHSDVNGSVIAVTTEVGVLAGVTNYGAYGKRLGSAISRFGYAGEWTDLETTYTYLRARWYDSSTGSFLSKDPIYQVTSEAYGYAGGNPLVRIDPSGLCNIFAGDLGNAASNCYLFLDSKFVQNLADSSAGMSDEVTMGGTKAVREFMGTNGVINSCSTSYKIGGYAGVVGSFVTPTGVAKAGAKASSKVYKNSAEEAFSKAGAGKLNIKDATKAVSQKDLDEYILDVGVFSKSKGFPLYKPGGSTYLPTAKMAQFNLIGNANGCHHCGTMIPGTLLDNWVKDHMPPTFMYNSKNGDQLFYPQCMDCMDYQRGAANRASRALKKGK